MLAEKQLILGTASWGWNTNKQNAFQLLDAWMEYGLRKIDTATNYPINKNPEDFRAAEKILLEYVQTHGLHDLEITAKIGALDNLRSPESNLKSSFIQMMGEELERIFGSNLSVLMFHWDKRNNIEDIAASLQALQLVCTEMNIRPGLSGIAHPEVYASLVESMDMHFDVQVKHNVLQSDLSRYKDFKPDNTHYFAYGINAGGVKLDSNYTAANSFQLRGGNPDAIQEKLDKIRALLPEWNRAFVRPPIINMNHIGLVYAALHPQIHGIVLGASNSDQLQTSLDFYRNFEVFDYADVFKSMSNV